MAHSRGLALGVGCCLGTQPLFPSFMWFDFLTARWLNSEGRECPKSKTSKWKEEKSARPLWSPRMPLPSPWSRQSPDGKNKCQLFKRGAACSNREGRKCWGRLWRLVTTPCWCVFRLSWQFQMPPDDKRCVLIISLPTALSIAPTTWYSDTWKCVCWLYQSNDIRSNQPIVSELLFCAILSCWVFWSRRKGVCPPEAYESGTTLHQRDITEKEMINSSRQLQTSHHWRIHDWFPS